MVDDEGRDSVWGGEHTHLLGGVPICPFSYIKLGFKEGSSVVRLYTRVITASETLCARPCAPHRKVESAEGWLCRCMSVAIDCNKYIHYDQSRPTYTDIATLHLAQPFDAAHRVSEAVITRVYSLTKDDPSSKPSFIYEKGKIETPPSR